MDIRTEYLKCAFATFKSIKELGDKTISFLTCEELHYSPESESNSIAIIVRHMSGNMLSRWTEFLTTDGEKPDRNRDTEFEGSYSTKNMLIEAWENGWAALFCALSTIQEADLSYIVYIRGEPHSVIQAIQRQVSHYSYHIGQIVYLGKQIKNKNWLPLSIPKGESQKYLEEKLRENRK